MSTKNWKPEVQVVNDEKWYDNALVFATKEEAKYSADELASRWLLVVGTRAVETDDPVNYRIDWDSREMVAVKHEAATAPGS